MTVTIGLPIYNAEKFLTDCIQSILNQTYKKLEIIILNDGSTDNSLEIIKKFNDSRIIIINDGFNKGLIFRLNQMIEIASGEFFVRMDADDIMFPDRIEKQLKIFQKYFKIDLVHGDAVSINDENAIIGYKKSSKIVNRQQILKGITPIHPTVMAKTEWFCKNKYLSDFLLIEDLELWYRTIESSTFYNINSPLIFYREISQSNSTKYLASIISREKFAKKYNLKYLKSIKFIKLNYLKFLYHYAFEKIGLKNQAVLYRSNSIDDKIKKKYNFILEKVIKE